MNKLESQEGDKTMNNESSQEDLRYASIMINE